MPLTSAQHSRLESLRRKYHIQFDQQLPQSLSSDQLKVVDAVRKLGAIKYGDYAVNSSNDYSDEPWKLQAKELAIQLTENAQRCNRRDEETWRSHCESLVFARANAEVACRRCRQRLWRSEVEVSRNDDSRASAALLQRQANRQPCRCPPLFRNLDQGEAKGTSKIFNYRKGEVIIHSSTIEEELEKHQKPDCVYGLRETRNFDIALHSRAASLGSSRPDSDEKLVIDMIKVSPLALDGDRLLFPFLFLEAKSGKAPDDWHSIKLQTCFPIRTALEIQQGLQRANGASSRWSDRPMVWFFMYKGEDWRLCIAVTDRGIRSSTYDENIYHIVDIWSGSISNRDGALQLILVIDYVFDWARDIYRPTVLTEVKLLVANRGSVRTVFSDPDIFSTKGSLFRSSEHQGSQFQLTRSLNVPFDLESAAHDPIETEPEPDPDELDDNQLKILSAEFHTMDSEKGMIRHAACLELQFRALFITRDNADTFVRSIAPNMVRTLLRKLLSFLAEESLSMQIDTFNDIEKEWTGYSSFARIPSLSQTRFYSIVISATYFSPRWDQVRELNIIAVAEDAFEILVNHSGLRAGRGNASVPKSLPTYAGMVVEKAKKLQVESRSATLMAAITRAQYRLQYRWTTFALSFERYQGSEARDLVHYTYNYFQKGTLAPNEPFLRGSDCLKRIPASSLPEVNTQDLVDPNASAVLLHGQGRGPESMRAKQSDVCMFLLDEPVQLPSSDYLTALLTDAVKNCDVYHTIRDNRIISPRSQARCERAWNIENTYGLYARGPEFADWIEHLEGLPPKRQGCPRITLKSGQYLLTRTLLPGYDRHHEDTINKRLRGSDTAKTQLWAFVSYKIMTAEIQYWRSEAQKRRKSGLSCCACCAATDVHCKIFLRDEPAESEDVCWLCESEIHNPQHPRWVWAALLGDLGRQYSRNSTHSRCARTAPRFHRLEEELYKQLCRYKDLNKPYKDISELWQQAEIYLKYRSRREDNRMDEERRVDARRVSTDEVTGKLFYNDPIVLD